MDKKLFSLFEVELLNEAKRIVPLVYNEKELIKFNTKEYKKYINKKYKLFSIDIEKSINHHKQVLEYDKKEFKANVEETIDNVAKDIVDNYSKYKTQSLFEIMPVLVSKYMKTHNDSVEHKAYVLYLNNSLKKYGKYLPTTNLIDLRNI